MPQGLIVAYATLLWASREAEVLLAFGGQLACEALNFALKRLIREERPRAVHRGKGYGMPSSHAQFMAFLAVYLGLFLLLRHRPRERRRRPAATTTAATAAEGKGSDGGAGDIADVAAALMPSQYAQQVLMAIAIVVAAALVAASRVYLGYHSPKQVFVGCGVGSWFAIVWYCFTAVLREYGVLQWALDLQITRLFRFRDLLLDEDLLESGWREYESRRNERERQSKKKTT